MSTPPEQKCPQCGGPLPADAPQGLCPRCLMHMHFASRSGPAETPLAAPPVEEIARHFPHLEILECLGRGGMGLVYKARQPALNRFVALKILAPERERDPAFAERFAHEARALAQLSHPNIVTVHDFGIADTLYYFVMEFVDGMNLRELMNAARISPREALAIVPQICDALQYAHDRGVIHRDIKPENILLDRQGRVKVADFGLAKLVGPVAGVADPGPPASPIPAIEGHTTSGTILGTPHYMAPEQVSRPSDVDHRADIYSLGVVFYQMLTGELPGTDIAAPSRKVVIDVRLDQVVLRALEQRPERRYGQVSELKTMCETLGAGRSSPAAAASPPSQPAHLSRTAIVGAVFAAIGVLGLLAGLAG